MKISEAFQMYRKNEVLAMGKSSSTNDWYIITEKLVIDYFGNINIRRIRVDDVHNFYLWMLKGRSQNTAREYLCKFRMVLDYFRQIGLAHIGADDIKIPKREKKQIRFITYEEFVIFLEEMGRPHRGYSNINRVRNIVMAKMLFYTGLRISELCALNRDSIQNRQFCIVGKSKDPRPGYITKDLEQDINHYLAMRTDSCPALFICEQTGKRITKTMVQAIFRRVSEQSGIYSVTPHTLRHSYATRLVEDGVDIRYVATLLGHQSLETTQKYTHIRDARLRQVYENAMEKY